MFLSLQALLCAVGRDIWCHLAGVTGQPQGRTTTPISSGESCFMLIVHLALQLWAGQQQLPLQLQQGNRHSNVESSHIRHQQSSMLLPSPSFITIGKD